MQALSNFSQDKPASGDGSNANSAATTAAAITVGSTSNSSATTVDIRAANPGMDDAQIVANFAPKYGVQQFKNNNFDVQLLARHFPLSELLTAYDKQTVIDKCGKVYTAVQYEKAGFSKGVVEKSGHFSAHEINHAFPFRCSIQ